MTSMLLALAIGAGGFSGDARCEFPAPAPMGYFSQALTMTPDGGGRVVHVAEVFPRGSRYNKTSQRPVAHFYHTVSRQPEFSLAVNRYWTAELVNPLMPAAALVSDEGYLVTLGDWGHDDGERAVVIYAPNGRHVRTIALTPLILRPGDVGVMTSCGIPWRNGATYYFSSGVDPKLYIITTWGPVLELTLATGAVARGARESFPRLGERIAAGYSGIRSAEVALSLIFSSITDGVR